MTFAVFPVEEAGRRLRLEAGIIAALHQAPDFGPSPSWLGRFSPEEAIRQSGMWLKQGLEDMPLTQAELRDLQDLLAHPSQGAAPAAGPSVPPAGQTATTAEIRAFIQKLLASHRRQGHTSCVLVSGAIHRAMGLSRKMPSVCSAMYQLMEPGDVVEHTTPSGKSSTIQIRYRLEGRSSFNGGMS